MMDRKQFVVIGLGRFGSSVAKTLYELGNEVLAVDLDEQTIHDISEYTTHAVQADATDDENLTSLGISNFDVAIIGMGVNVQDSVMTTLLVKEAGVKYVIAKANTELHAKILYKIGADKVVFPERDTGVRVAHNLVSSNILDYIELSSDYSVAEMVSFKEWNGKTLQDLDMRVKYGINIIAVKRSGKINISPPADFEIKDGDILVAVGDCKEIKNIKKHVSK